MTVHLAVGVAAEATTWTCSLAKIKKYIGYLYKNLKSLQVAKRKPDAKTTNRSRFTQRAHRRKLKEVSTSNARQIISTNNMSRLHPRSHYSASKQASKLAEEIDETVQTAQDHLLLPKQGAKFDLTDYLEFEYAALDVDQVWTTLKDEKVRLCSCKHRRFLDPMRKASYSSSSSVAQRCAKIE